MTRNNDVISVRGAKEHNLKNINVDIPRGKLVVITGLSGSGKSSLAFDTIYAEGQRRYVESLSSYARQFLNIQDKPDVEAIDGLSPAIAIDQKTTSKNPRSTVGTMTEIYDYLRLLFARIGIPHSPATGKPIESQSKEQMAHVIATLPVGAKLNIVAPLVKGRKGALLKEINGAKEKGIEKLKIDGRIYPIDEVPSLERNQRHDIDAIIDTIEVENNVYDKALSLVEKSLSMSNGVVYLEILSAVEGSKYKDGERIVLSAKYSCPESGFSIEEIEPRMFSFNSPFGACPACDGLGTEMVFDEDLVVPDKSKSLYDGAIAPWQNTQSKQFIQTLEGLAKHYGFNIHDAFEDLPDDIQHKIMYGSGDEIISITYNDGARSYKSNRPFEGIMPIIARRYKESESSWIRDELKKYQQLSKCSVCNGYRLNEKSLSIKVGGLHIGEVSNKSIDDAMKWFSSLNDLLSDTHKQIAEKLLKEVGNRLSFLMNVGLEYLTLSRESSTLSGGEAQRIRLATQIGAGLSGVVYVLDEPSIGLHQRDNNKLLNTLKYLRDLGNTVIVVEHDEDTMRQADYIIDIGPGAGIHGGKVVAEGTIDEIMKVEESITGQYLSGKKKIAVPKKRRSISKHRFIRVEGARVNNLQNIDVGIPVGVMTCFTGVSGSGKSSFVIETFYKAAAKHIMGTKAHAGAYKSIRGLEFVDKVIEIDQSPIGRTPRSNPATYTGAFAPIRDLFTSLSESKAKGYKSGHFSFNVKGGRCEACQGDGLIKIEMHFLPDIYVTCDSCHGHRYNKDILNIKYNGKSIADVLEMTVEEAVIFFKEQPTIQEKCKALEEVGLGYVKLGQSATTLSGGEAQRIKLAKELSKKATGRTLYILDEPTRGLHSKDISRLLKVLHSLVDAGNTMVVIEHNLDVIKTADYIVDIGPEGGCNGGRVVAVGTPEEVVKCEESVTAQYLKHYL